MTAPCIFVTGVWKSGNHLAYAALNEIGIPGPMDGISGHHLHGRFALIKGLVRGPRSADDAIHVGLESDVAVSGRYLQGRIKKLSGKILGGHAAHSPGLVDLLRNQGARLICIRRDPRDILISFADWIGGRPDYYMHPLFENLTREDRIRLLLNGGQGARLKLNPFPTVLERAEGWLTEQDILQVRFEELIGASGGGDMRSQMQIVTDIHAHIDAAKPLDELNVDNIYGGTLTFNQGRSRRWEELEDASVVDEIESTLGPALKTWGYAR